MWNAGVRERQFELCALEHNNNRTLRRAIVEIQGEGSMESIYVSIKLFSGGSVSIVGWSVVALRSFGGETSALVPALKSVREVRGGMFGREPLA